MKSSAGKIKMTSFDDLFGGNEETVCSGDVSNIIQDIELSRLFPFAEHPFKVLDDDKMEETKESIAKYGVLVPLLLDLPTIPAIVRDLDDEESTIVMVDSNIQRENLLFSEKAFAYKMKLDAIKRKTGRRSKENGTQLGHHSDGRKSVEIVAYQSGESRNQIQCYIRLTELDSVLISMVDEKKLAFNTAVELSYLSMPEQTMLLSKVEELAVISSVAQAAKLKKYSGEGNVI